MSKTGKVSTYQIDIINNEQNKGMWIAKVK